MSMEKIGAFYTAGRKSYCVGCQLDIAKGEPYCDPWWAYGRVHLDCFEKVAASHKTQFEKNVADIRSQIIQAKREMDRVAP